MPQGHSHETTELKLLFLNEGSRFKEENIAMKNQHYLRRFPFRAGDGSTQYRVMGDMTNDPDMDFQVAIESPTDMRKLPFCADCSGELASGELVYGAGARKCMQCGSVFLVVESPSNGIGEGSVAK